MRELIGPPPSWPCLSRPSTSFFESPPRRGWPGTRPSAGPAMTNKERALADAEGALHVAGAQVGEDGFAGDGGLALGDDRPHALGEIDVDARAEADEADALTDADARALANEADDPACDEPGDLHDADAAPVGGDEQAIALVV